MTWNNLPWHMRRNLMGDTAEQKFEEIHDHLDVKYVRYGLSRPPFKVITLPRFLRYTPDYLMADRLVEVQGVGRDATFKLKTDKHAALMAWNDMVYPVHLWVWDSHRSKHTTVPLVDVPTGDVRAFDDGKTFYAVPRGGMGPWLSPP